MLFQVIHIVLAGITGIMVLCRGRIAHALAIFAECAVFFFVMISMVMAAAFAMAFADNDHFADKLELPKDVQLSEPLDGGYEQHFQRIVSDTFQKGCRRHRQWPFVEAGGGTSSSCAGTPYGDSRREAESS